jgi:hypothetical protein
MEHLEQKKNSKNKKKYICEKCDFACSKLSNYNEHLMTRKHQIRTNMPKKKMPKMPKPESIAKFFCESCNFSTMSESIYNKHLLTRKHQRAINDYDSDCNKNLYPCKLCNKIYKSRSSIWYHMKHNHNSDSNDNKKSLNILDDLFDQSTYDENDVSKLLKQNAELIELVKDMVPKIGNNIDITNNTTNKTFNLQIFLNEDCKDAMNLTDFVDNIKLQLQDIDRIGNEGYTKGISNIIVKELNSIDVTKRPLHCSDIKRETLYVKDDNRWEKDIEKDKINKMISKVENKNLQLLPEWKDANPGYNDSESKTSEEYNNLVMNVVDSSRENRDKIIKNILKETKIDK